MANHMFNSFATMDNCPAIFCRFENGGVAFGVPVLRPLGGRHDKPDGMDKGIAGSLRARRDSRRALNGDSG
jgi:hypothetical protein